VKYLQNKVRKSDYGWSALTAACCGWWPKVFGGLGFTRGGISLNGRETTRTLPVNPASEKPNPVAEICAAGKAEGRDDYDIQVAATCHVMTVLERQLAEINSDIEQSVSGICIGFQGMAQRAGQAVDAAESSLKCIGSESDEAGSKETKNLVARMQSVVITLLKQMTTSCDFSKLVSEKLSTLESSLAEVERTLEQMESFATDAKLVALNGQIEAERLGVAGRAFSVVAKETKSLATQADETSQSIRGLVKKLAGQLRETAIGIRERAELDSKSMSAAEREARSLLSEIESSHQRMVDSLGHMGGISSVLRNDIAKAVMSMQFQDRVSQRIAHVIETMEMLDQYVHPDLTADRKVAAMTQSKAWLDEVSKRYTMDSERFASGDDDSCVGAEAGNGSEDEFSVELF
jgi:methyl-accepting chemotaxis protein